MERPVAARMARTAMTVAILCSSAALAPSASAAMPETLELDSYTDPAVSGAYGPVTTTDALVDGEEYVAVVEGTTSHFPPAKWSPPANQVCGSAETAPMFPSPGRPTSPAGQDAEFVFALPMNAGWTCGVYPEHKTAFQIDTGSGFAHVEPDGAPTSPTTGHEYTYRFTGEGTPVSFLMQDGFTGDNNGVLRITVDAADGCPGECPDPPGPGPNQQSESNQEPLQEVAPENPVIAVSQPSVSPPTPRACLSRRRFPILVRSRPRDPVVSARIYLNGRRLKVRRRVVRGQRRLTTVVDLRGRRHQRVTLRIIARTRSGRVLRGVRRYWTCRPQLPFGIPPL
jgi:hypothetical protein